jgi:NADPH2:quinone reductase
VRAIVVSEYGGPEALRLVEIDRPRPAPSQVLADVTVSGLNFLDVYQRTGSTPLRRVSWLGGGRRSRRGRGR